MSKICVNCVKEINDKEVFCLACHEKVVEIANQRIAELEEQLANSIRPKFKIGQEVYIIIQEVVRMTSINSFRFFEGNELSYYCKYVDGERMYLELDESEIFATKEEAQAKLKELQGENNVKD